MHFFACCKLCHNMKIGDAGCSFRKLTKACWTVQLQRKAHPSKLSICELRRISCLLHWWVLEFYLSGELNQYTSPQVTLDLLKNKGLIAGTTMKILICPFPVSWSVSLSKSRHAISKLRCISRYVDLHFLFCCSWLQAAFSVSQASSKAFSQPLTLIMPTGNVKLLSSLIVFLFVAFHCMSSCYWFVCPFDWMLCWFSLVHSC